MPTEEEVREALKEVIDPELNVDVVDLGLVYKVEVDGDKVTVTMTLTSPGCPVGPMIVGNAKQAVEAMDDVEEAEILLTFEPPWSPDKASEEVKAMFDYL